MIDRDGRSEIARATAKAIAYKNSGKDAEAEQWARRLVELLECSGILAPVVAQSAPAPQWHAQRWEF